MQREQAPVVVSKETIQSSRNTKRTKLQSSMMARSVSNDCSSVANLTNSNGLILHYSKVQLFGVEGRKMQIGQTIKAS